MKFGICIHCQAPPDEFIAQVRAIEAQGFDYLWLSDMGLLWHDVFVYLALAAANTERIQIGACVHHPYVRHPAVTANGILSIDHVSGGRANFGVGIGGGVVGSLGFKAARVATMREMMVRVRELFDGEVVSTDVEPMRMHAAKLPFRPLQPIPLYLAATGPRMLALGGELADGVFAHVGASAPIIAAVRAHCGRGEVNRAAALGPLDFSPFVHTSVSNNRTDAIADCREGATRIGSRGAQYLKLLGISDEQIAGLAHSQAAFDEVFTDELVDSLTLSGTAGDCITKIQAMSEVGVDHVTVFSAARDTLGLINTYGCEILPRFGKG